MFMKSYSTFNMICKAFVLLSLGLVLVKAHTLPGKNENQLIPFEQLGDSLIGKLEELILKAIKTAKDKLLNLADEFYSTVKGIISSALGQISKLLCGLINQLNALKERAKEVGIDIADCLTDEGNLTNLPRKYIPRIIDCGDNITIEGKLLIERAIQSVEDTIETVFDLKDEYSKCGFGWEALTCRIGVTYKIGKAIVTVPLDILGIAVDTVPEVISLYPRLQGCVIKETKDFLAEGKDIVYNISDCIESKLNRSESLPSLQ